MIIFYIFMAILWIYLGNVVVSEWSTVTNRRYGTPNKAKMVKYAPKRGFPL